MVTAAAAPSVGAAAVIAAPGERYDAELWVSHSSFPGHGTSVTTSPDGAVVYVAGARGHRIGRSYATVAYDADTGEERWLALYNPDDDPDRFDRAVEVAATPDGTAVVVTGVSYASCCDSNLATVGYDADDGSELWVARYGSIANTYDGATSLAVTPDSRVAVVTGYVEGAGSCTDIATVAYDTATGAQLWKARYDGPGHFCDGGMAVRVAPDGATAVVTGYSVGDGTDYDYATVAYDAATGARRWVARYTRPSNTPELPDALATTADAVVVTGRTAGGVAGTGADYATVAYDLATGAERWTARYDGRASGDDRPTAVAVSPDGATAVVTGTSAGRTGDDYATVAYDADDGAERWARSYDGPAGDEDDANAVVVTPDGRTAVVTGSSDGRTGANYATAFYDVATGNLVHLFRYNEPGLSADAAHAVAASPDGTAVFVTGTSVGPDGRRHVGTVAYPA